MSRPRKLRWLASVHILALLHHEPTSDLPSLAASYGFGIAEDHPFVDGSKRPALQAMYLFLGLNGLRIDASEEDVVATILPLASGDLDEPGLAAWVHDHVTAR